MIKICLIDPGIKNFGIMIVNDEEQFICNNTFSNLNQIIDYLNTFNFTENSLVYMESQHHIKNQKIYWYILGFFYTKFKIKVKPISPWVKNDVMEKKFGQKFEKIKSNKKLKKLLENNLLKTECEKYKYIVDGTNVNLEKIIKFDEFLDLLLYKIYIDEFKVNVNIGKGSRKPRKIKRLKNKVLKN